jgi:opacity protein-like surface antigen
MNRSILGLGLAVALAAVQARGEIHIEAGAGVYKPMGDSAKFFENGYRVGLGAEYMLGSNFSIALNAAYNRNLGDTAALREIKCPPSPPAPGGCSAEAEAQIFELTVSPKFYLVNSENIGAYLLAGGGPHWFWKNGKGGYPPPGPSVRTESSERTIGVHFGFGAEAAFPGSLRLGITPVYHLVFAKNQQIRYGAVMLYLKY